MKKANANVLGLFTLLIVTAGAGTAFAGHHDDGFDRRGKAMQLADANRDGRIDDGERRAFMAGKKAEHQARKNDLLRRYDTNRNGALDDNERAIAKRDRAAARFHRLDTNRDGQLSWAEFQAEKMGADHQGRRRGWFGAGPGHRGGNAR